MISLRMSETDSSVDPEPPCSCEPHSYPRFHSVDIPRPGPIFGCFKNHPVSIRNIQRPKTPFNIKVFDWDTEVKASPTIIERPSSLPKNFGKSDYRRSKEYASVY